MMTDPQDLQRAARIFKSLSHPGRLQVACLLGSGRYPTQRDLIEKLGWPQSTVARHVGALRSGGLVTARRCGTEVHLELVEPVAHQLMDTVCEWVHPETGEHFNHSLSGHADGRGRQEEEGRRLLREPRALPSMGTRGV